MKHTLAVDHRIHVSARPYEDVVAALYAETGSVEEGFGDLAAQATTLKDFERIFRGREGSSGFMRFAVFDHGKWLQIYGKRANALMAVIGNPLIAWTMLRHDVAAGLNVPVRLSIHEDDDGQTRVTYDLPSTLMGSIQNPDVIAAAQRLDEKLNALAVSISSVTA